MVALGASGAIRVVVASAGAGGGEAAVGDIDGLENI